MKWFGKEVELFIRNFMFENFDINMVSGMKFYSFVYWSVFDFEYGEFKILYQFLKGELILI